MPYRPTQSHSTVIKPYYKDDSFKPLQDAPWNAPQDTPQDALEDAPEDAPEDALEENYN